MEPDDKKKKEKAKKIRGWLLSKPGIMAIIVAAVVGGYVGYMLLNGNKPAANPTNQNTPAQQKIKVIQYNSKYLPLDGLEIANHQGCSNVSHYHAKDGKGITATDGTFVADPGPECGYGKVSDRPTLEISK